MQPYVILGYALVDSRPNCLLLALPVIRSATQACCRLALRVLAVDAEAAVCCRVAPARHANPLYRTQMCRHFMRGNCWRGTNCNFAHAWNEIRPRQDEYDPMDE